MRLILPLFLAMCAGCGSPSSGDLARNAPNLQIATFECDATPPPGHPLCGGWIKPLEAAEDPLLLKGVVIADAAAGTRYVIASLDWCLLHSSARDAFRKRLGGAAACPERQVAVQTVHQHDAPLADADAQRLLDREKDAPPHLDLKFFDDLTGRAADAVREAVTRMKPLTHVGLGKAKVEKFASNRRSVIVDGKILQRGSSSQDPRHADAPEGLIDPWLRTVTLFSGDAPLARLHYYATHPQSFYGQGRATSDTAGLARRRMEREEGVFQLYFTGCGGNIAAGKYNRGTPEDRIALTDRLFAAMKSSAAASAKHPVDRFLWKTADVRFSPRQEPEFAEAGLRKQIADPAEKPVVRLKAALNLAWIDRLKTRPDVDLSALRLGPAWILHLPGESFVEYQLHAQAQRPDEFVCVAAYGDCGPGYICLDGDLTKGGYEPSMSRVGPPSEERLKGAIEDLLR